MLLRLCPVPIAVLTVYNEVNVLLYREILEISVAVEGYAITTNPLMFWTEATGTGLSTSPMRSLPLAETIAGMHANVIAMVLFLRILFILCVDYLTMNFFPSLM